MLLITLVIFKDENKRYVISVKDIGVDDFDSQKVNTPRGLVLKRQGSNTIEETYEASILLLAGINGFESSYALFKLWVCTQNT